MTSPPSGRYHTFRHAKTPNPQISPTRSGSPVANFDRIIIRAKTAAWFTAGVIAPIFLEVESLKLVFSAGLGILFTGIFIGLALYIVQTNK